MALMNKVNLYFRNIYLDYYEVFKEIRQSAKRRPLKSTLYGGTTLFVLNLFRTNESLRSYTSEVVAACNKLGAVSENARNPRSSEYIRSVGELNCHKLLDQIDLGFSTVIYKTDANPELALYRQRCSHMKPTWREFLTERIVDLGILGRWISLEINMRDYDINEEEYKGLSP